MTQTQRSRNTWLTLLIIFTFFLSAAAMAQNNHLYRIAKIQVDPAQLVNYNIALKEQMTTAIRVEPGVLSYYAVADKKEPTHITIFEVYADSTAYKAHIQAPHFKKYKETVQHMVTFLEVTDVELIGSAKKPGM
ncbi:putative quinol monooxygenase [Mucilaginibacter sp. KACC 22773]|uniref:putative quinol monooxygenase n=1 Tax=Mucilaginibacter sp. KACC 22773 TaxID=3025671 RepID=UPI0023661967|nr:putative quinol monooxygenase [Mucilaginibacter sp. KACC 22773]WDF77166.1 putative quinol monooxygenase [Mucilaginibacter sp. KACC 22773]